MDKEPERDFIMEAWLEFTRKNTDAVMGNFTTRDYRMFCAGVSAGVKHVLGVLPK